MGYKPTGGKPGRPKKGMDSHGNPAEPTRPEPSGNALGVAEARRSDAVRSLERELASIDREPVVSMSGQPLPEHIRRQRMEGRQDVAGKLERLRGLSGYELVAELAPALLPRTEPQPEPVRLEERLVRGPYIGGMVRGAKPVPVNPDYMRQYHERQAREAELAEHQDRVRRGQEALALAALRESEQG